jgi:hypothetical protein
MLLSRSYELGKNRQREEEREERREKHAAPPCGPLLAAEPLTAHRASWTWALE